MLIWQAGRATSATGLAFKPIQIGQSVFIDEGNGKFNPAPQALDEAVLSEWPGREVGVFVSIGTGKRPPGTGNQQHMWWEGFASGAIGDFAEAKRRLIMKIEETVFQECFSMLTCGFTTGLAAKFIQCFSIPGPWLRHGPGGKFDSVLYVTTHFKLPTANSNTKFNPACPKVG